MDWLENLRVRREWKRTVERIFIDTDESGNRTMKASHFVCVTTLAVALSACAFTDEQSTVGAEERRAAQGRTLILDGTEMRIGEGVEVVSWKCRKYGSTDSRDDVLVEVGQFSFTNIAKSYEGYQEMDESDKADFMKGLNAIEDLAAFVLYDGTNEGAFAVYKRSGLNQGWIWGSLGDEDEKPRYLILIEADGTGLYYDFSTYKDGDKIIADDVFECSR